MVVVCAKRTTVTTSAPQDGVSRRGQKLTIAVAADGLDRRAARAARGQDSRDVRGVADLAVVAADYAPCSTQTACRSQRSPWTWRTPASPPRAAVPDPDTAEASRSRGGVERRPRFGRFGHGTPRRRDD
jgi:hypothetical protein